MFPIYHIQAVSTGSNSYTTDRSETWTVVRLPDQEFVDRESAQDFVRDSNFRSLPGDLQSHAMRPRCFPGKIDDPIYKHLRFFLEPGPDMRAMKKALEGDGVRVLRD